MGDYLFYLDADASALNIEDYVVVTKQASAAAGLDNTYTTQILKSDGKQITVETTKTATPGDLYTYEINDDGYYELTAAPTDKTGTDFDEVATSGVTFTKATKDDEGYMTYKNAKQFISDDAVVFVKEGTTSNDYSVTTGAKLNATKTDVTVKYMGAVKNDSTGYNTVELAYVVSDSLGASSSNYAYVTGDVVKYQDANDDTKFYVEIPVGSTTLVTESKTKGGNTVVDKAYALSEGDVITYDLLDGKVSDLTVYNMDILVKADADASTGTLDFYAAVIAYVDNSIKFNNHVYTAADVISAGQTTYEVTMTEDTEIIYVNSSDNSIAEGGKIQLASTDGTEGNYYANAKAVVNAATKEVDLLIIDVNNDILDIQ